VKGEIKDALVSRSFQQKFTLFKEAEKRYDKSKSAHESAVIKLRTINEKTKANVSKVVEAEQERDATKSQLDQTEKDSYKTLYEMNFKAEVETMERLVAYTEACYDYFERSALRVRQLFKEVDSYRDYIDRV
jgi:vacuolar-type H+-ATPase subunit I/STV1